MVLVEGFHRLEQNLRESRAAEIRQGAAPKFTVEKMTIDGDILCHVDTLRAFAKKILSGEPLVAEGKEGINSLLLSNAIYLSSWLDKTIEIPFDEDLFLAELNKRRALSKCGL